MKGNASALLQELQAKHGARLSLSLGEASPSPRIVDADVDDDRLPAAARAALLLDGAVVELASLPGCGAKSLGLLLLAACARSSAAPTWLCAIDRTLHAGAVSSLDVPLHRLVVLAPPARDVLRIAVRATSSGVFRAILVDMMEWTELSGAAVAVRRLALRAADSHSLVVLLTATSARRAEALPVAARVELSAHADGIHGEVQRHRNGWRGSIHIPHERER